MEDTDICIIGGSIAGNYLCYLLSRLNIKIVVIEEHEQIGLPFECAGIISQKLGKLIKLPPEIVLNQVEVAKVVAPSGKYIKLAGDEKPYVIDRIALDRLFHEKVKDKPSVTYFLGEKFRKFEYKRKNQESLIIAHTSKRELRCKLLIGCDGPFSTVGRQLGVVNQIIYGTQIRVKGRFSKNEAVMWFDPKWKELFGWIVPEGNNNIYRIGMGAAHNLAKNFKSFLKKLGVEYSQKLDQQGGIIPFGTMNKVAFDNVLLLGDSAGQVKATTGGGIVMLLTAAKFAAHAIKKSMVNNNFSKKFLQLFYEKPCKKELNRQLKIHFLIRTIFARFTSHDFEYFFQIVKTSRIESIISLYGDMDFPKTLFIKLLKNSAVFKFLLRFLRKNPTIFIDLLKILRK